MPYGPQKILSIQRDGSSSLCNSVFIENLSLCLWASNVHSLVFLAAPLLDLAFSYLSGSCYVRSISNVRRQERTAAKPTHTQILDDSRALLHSELHRYHVLSRVFSKNLVSSRLCLCLLLLIWLDGSLLQQAWRVKDRQAFWLAVETLYIEQFNITPEFNIRGGTV
jgi:hypothetical protein